MRYTQFGANGKYRINEETEMSILQRRTKMTVVLLLSLGLIVFACKDDGTTQPPTPERVKLTLIDVSVKETFLHIAVSNPASNETLSLQHNGTTVITFTAVSDTNIMDTALTQTTTYQYTASLTANNSVAGTSNTTSAQTLAPTSQNFTWQTSLLGDGNESTLHDVAIISDSLVYVVGELYLQDSTGAIDPTVYNLASWAGHNWSITRAPYYYQGQAFYSPIRSVFAFDDNDTWFGIGNLIHWDGHNYVAIQLPPSAWGAYHVNKIWGSSHSDLFIVGEGGSIARFDGANWQRLESGTSTLINDAWGVVSPVTGKEEVYCAVSSFFVQGDGKIIRIKDNTTVDSLGWDTGRSISSLWTNKGFPVYTNGDGVFENTRGAWNEVDLGVHFYTNRIRGNGLNDIFLVGSGGLIAHYNGLEWHVFSEVYDATYSGLSVRNGLVVAVGERNGRGVVTIGRRWVAISLSVGGNPFS